MKKKTILKFIIIIFSTAIIALAIGKDSLRTLDSITFLESGKKRAMFSTKQNSSFKIKPISNEIASPDIHNKIDIKTIQSLEKELRGKIVELNKQKKQTNEFISPIIKRAPKNQQGSPLQQKLDSILSKIEKSDPSSIYQRFPRYDQKGRVLLRIKYQNENITKENLEQKIIETGGDIYAHIPDKGLLEAYLPPSKLNDFVAYYWIKSIDLVGPAISRIGSVTTEADILLNTQAVRQQYNINGDRVKIGVISTGVDNIAQSQATGDLPLDVTVLANGGWSEPDDEGTAILEIIHDIAPGAKLFFHDGGSETRFIMGINAFIDNKCDIIVDDIGYFKEPYFEDGMVAQAAANAVENGVIFVSAAGNSAETHAETNWRSTHDNPEDLNLNEILFDVPALVFPNDEELIVFELGPYHGAWATLQWSERFGHSGHDYDIYIYDAYDYLDFLYDAIVWYDWVIYGYLDWLNWGYWYDSFGHIHYGEPPYPSVSIVEKSDNTQNGFQDPSEYVEVINYTNNWYSYVMVVEGRSSPSTTDTLEMFFYEFGYSEAINLPGEEGTPVGSIFGHAAIPGVLSVGAINVNDSGLDNIEPFSSQGPCYVPFSSATLRSKPDICAVDGVSVTGAGGFPSPFFGTSAAAPHIAAIAALLKDYNPSLSSAEIRSILKETAFDLGAIGHDSIFGYGRVNVYGAIVNIDSDGDGVSNDQDNCPDTSNPDQANNDTDDMGDVCDPDDDNDGMPDDWEEQNGLNPFVDDASGDADNDGYSNYNEYRFESDPNDPNSIPKPKVMPWIPLLLDE